MKLYLLFPISTSCFSSIGLNVETISMLPRLLRKFLSHVSDELFDELKGLDGAWWMREEQHRVYLHFTSIYDAPIGNCPFYSTKANRNSFHLALLQLSRGPFPEGPGEGKSEAICVNGLPNHFSSYLLNSFPLNK